MGFTAIRYAVLRTPLRNSAYRLRRFAHPLDPICISETRTLQVFLRLQNAYNYAAGLRLCFDVLVPAQHAHPALQRSPIKARLAFDLPIAHRRPAEHPTGSPGLMRL